LAYAGRLHNQLAREAGHDVGGLDDASRSGDPLRKRDLECTFLSFAVTSNDGRWHDAEMGERFRVAVLRADQEWDQFQAGLAAQRRDGRRQRFRRDLEALLSGEAYAYLDAVTRERLLSEVTELVFRPQARGR
jgi:hypothetical protein